MSRKLSKINGQWWIVGVPNDEKLPDLPGIGPYANKWDADEDMEGLERYGTLKPRDISIDSKAKFTLANEPAKKKPAPYFDQPGLQKNLIDGCDCLPGQLDLFTEGELR